MLIDYQALQSQLSAEALDSLIHEYLYQQIGDHGFEQITAAALAQANQAVRQKLATAELMVEYSEAEQTVAIKSKDQLAPQT